MKLQQLFITAVLVFAIGSAHADTLTWRHIGGAASNRVEITGLKSDMTDDALLAEAWRACPHGYESGEGSGFTKADGTRCWRSTFTCLDGSLSSP